jgi:Mrp family chromosome partitioning ATPase
VDALRDGAAMLSREGNRIAALALLWSAVGIDPTDFASHRRLAATLASVGEVEAAAEEYARYIELSLKQDDIGRAAHELAFALASLGDAPQLCAVGTNPVPLRDVADALGQRADSPQAEIVRLALGRDGAAPERPSVNGAAEPAPRPELATDPLTRTFDGLAIRIDAMDVRCVGFTSALLGEGVSTIALGTALSLAALRQDTVLLVDANWIDRSLTCDAGLQSAPGLADYLGRKGALSELIQNDPGSGIAFLPAGDGSSARPTLRTVSSFLATDVASFQTVVVDLPPVLAGELFVLPWATMLDQLFVVLRESATPLPVVREALKKIALVAQPRIVLNRTAAPSPDVAATIG